MMKKKRKENLYLNDKLTKILFLVKNMIFFQNVWILYLIWSRKWIHD